MRIKEEIRKDTAVLVLKGMLMHGPEVAPFHEHIRGLVDRGITQVVVDLSNVKWLGSAMLGVMVASQRTLWDAGGSMCLSGIRKRVASVFIATQLDSLFEVCEDADAAVAVFDSDPMQRIHA
ncbi:MAG: STAS domain-containing protein [bacterium]|nr:STAS domain-containing protein [bacterium]